MIRKLATPSAPTDQRKGLGVGVSEKQEAHHIFDCSECGALGVSVRHFYAKNGRCRKTWRQFGDSLQRLDHLPAKPRPAGNADYETDLAIERALSRYTPSGSPDFEKLEPDDWRTVKVVLDYLLANHRTGAVLPARRRLHILLELEKFPALQVAIACASFLDGNCIATKKPVRYFMGVVRGSAATKFAEIRHERHKRREFRLETP